MYNSKLIKIYSSLDYQEKSLFKKWVKSPMHNQHEELIKLFDFIASKRILTPKIITKELVYQFVSNNASYDDLRMRHVMSLGVAVLENFVRFLVQNRDEFNSSKNLINFYQERNLNKYALQEITKAKKQQQVALLQNSQYYYQQYQLEQRVFEQKEEEERVRATNLQEISNSYAIAFVIETLKNACTGLTYQNLNKKNKYQIPFLEMVLDDVKKGAYQNIVAVQFYYNSYQSLTNPENPTYYQELKKLLLQYNQTLPSNELKNIHVIALNFCIKQLNNGSENYVQEVFDLFKYGLEQQILIKDNVLSRFTYKNIVTAALRLKEIDWTSHFIKEYTPFLESKYRTNYEHYASAKLLYTKGAYAQTMTLLHQVEYDDLFLNLDAKMMLVKIYYEEGSFDALDSLLSSFYVYLQRKEIMGYHQDNYKNIIKLTKKMLYLSSQDKAAIRKFKKQVEETNPLTERAWLLQQISE